MLPDLVGRTLRDRGGALGQHGHGGNYTVSIKKKNVNLLVNCEASSQFISPAWNPPRCWLTINSVNHKDLIYCRAALSNCKCVNKKTNRSQQINANLTESEGTRQISINVNVLSLWLQSKRARWGGLFKFHHVRQVQTRSNTLRKRY